MLLQRDRSWTVHGGDHVVRWPGAAITVQRVGVRQRGGTGLVSGRYQHRQHEWWQFLDCQPQLVLFRTIDSSASTCGLPHMSPGAILCNTTMFQNCKGCLQLVPKSSYFDLEFCNDLRPPIPARMQCTSHSNSTIWTGLASAAWLLYCTCTCSRIQDCFQSKAGHPRIRKFLDLFSYVVLWPWPRPKTLMHPDILKM